MIEDVARLRLTVDSTGLTEARGKLNALGKSSKSASGSMKGLGASSTATKLALGGLAIGVTAVGVTIVKTTKEWLRFNVAMKEVETIAGATGKEMQALRLDALRVAQAVGVDATEAAQGFYQAISAGIPTADVKEFVEVSAQLGKGGLADIGSSTDLLTTALNAYGKSAGEARKVSDQLFRTVKLGKTNIPQLASSLARVAPVASTAGVELSELLGIVASTTKQGVKTAESMTQIKAAIVALLNPSETMAGIFDELGVSSGRQLIAQEGLAGALEKVRIASKGNDKVLNQALKSIEAYSLSATITKDKLQETSDAIKEIGTASGDTAKASAIAADELGTAFKKLGNSLLILAENANKATGASEGLSGAIAGFADILADPDTPKAYLRALAEFPAVFSKFIFLNQGAKEQVSNFDATVELSIDTQRRYADAVRRSAEVRGLAGLSQIDIANKLLQAEKALTLQKTITAGYGGEAGIEKLDADIKVLNGSLKVMADKLNRGKITLGEYKKGLAELADLKSAKARVQTELDASRVLENQIAQYKRIFQQQGPIAKEQFRITVEVQRLNESLRNAKITTEEWRAETEKLEKEYDNIEKRVKAFGRTFATFFGEFSKLNGEIITKGERALEIAQAQSRVDAILLENTDENIGLLEKKLRAFDDLLGQKKELTEAEEGIRNLLLSQLGILKEQSTEARKSRATLDFEALQSSYRTEEEQASLDYSRDVGTITQGGASPEEQAMLLERARERFVERIALDDLDTGGAVSQAQDLQEGINRDASDLSLDYGGDDQYEIEKERLRAFEAEKMEIVREATNLTEQQRADITRRIQEETAEKMKQVEEQKMQDRLSSASDFFSDLSTISKAFGEKGAKAAKAFAIVSATIDTYKGAVAAYSSTASIPVVGPFLAPIAATAAIAAGMAQVSAIKAQKYQMGGIVGGGSYGGDMINAKLNSGEMVLNQTQQKNLFAQANNPIAQKQSGDVTIVNNTGVEVEGETSTDANGNIEIIIARAVEQTKADLQNEAQEGGGDLFPAMEQTYGLNRQGI